MIFHIREFKQWRRQGDSLRKSKYDWSNEETLSCCTCGTLLITFLWRSLANDNMHEKWTSFQRRTLLSRASRGPFLESPETFRAQLAWHKFSLYLSSRGTKLCSYFNFYSLDNIWKDQLLRMSGSASYEWLFEPEKFRETRPSYHNSITVIAVVSGFDT